MKLRLHQWYYKLRLVIALPRHTVLLLLPELMVIVLSGMMVTVALASIDPHPAPSKLIVKVPDAAGVPVIVTTSAAQFPVRPAGKPGKCGTGCICCCIGYRCRWLHLNIMTDYQFLQAKLMLLNTELRPYLPVVSE